MSDTTAPFVGLAQSDFVAGIRGTLPTGRAWNRDPASTLTAYINTRADALYAVHAAQVDLLQVESDPSQTTALLPDFETNYGLPDPCTPAGSTLQQRRSALLSKIAAQGGQSIAYYVEVAAALGVAVTITEFTPFRTQVGRTTQALNGQDAAFVWQVNAPSVNVIPFRTQVSATGENLRTIDNTSLACRLNALKPAHTELLFNYD